MLIWHAKKTTTQQKIKRKFKFINLKKELSIFLAFIIKIITFIYVFIHAYQNIFWKWQVFSKQLRLESLTVKS